MSPTVRFELGNGGRVATVVLDRPPLNILDIPTNDLLAELLSVLATDERVAVLVVRGAGLKAFCAGVAVEDHTPERLPAMLGAFHRVLHALADLPCLTVAAVHGHCLGASDTARFGLPEIKLGCFPPVATAWWPQRFGWSTALELATTGRSFTAEEAERRGLVTRRGPDLDEVVDGLLAELLAQSTPVLRLTKKAARIGQTSDDPHAALAATERLYLDELTKVGDMQEGVDAFFAKRPAVWRHR
jgi:cyclohexa-1,5-dienecarbonyl-CoA hydratase